MKALLVGLILLLMLAWAGTGDLEDANATKRLDSR